MKTKEQLINECIEEFENKSKPDINGREDYPKPRAYKIKGGGTFADKADNVIMVWRSYRLSDPFNPLVLISLFPSICCS